MCAGTFQARDNVALFIQWARSLGLDQSILFETDDLVKAKNEKNVLYWCVLCRVELCLLATLNIVISICYHNCPSHQ